MKIKSIAVTLTAPMSDHAANRGEKLLGNASSIKRRPDGRVYVSGQMQRHALFSAIDRLNEGDPGKGKTFVANGDGPSANIALDLRSDLGGYMIPDKGDYSGRRTAPLTATPAVALAESNIGRDLLIRLKMNESEEAKQKQALATNEFSQSDLMHMSFHLDVGMVGMKKMHSYDGERHVASHYVDHIESDNERARRVRLFLEATRSMTDYANQARNATSGEPREVLIVLDGKMSRKAARYFAPETTDTERKRLLEELEERGALCFLGSDLDERMDSVSAAYRKAFEALEANELYAPESVPASEKETDR